MIFTINNIRELLENDKIQWSGHILKRIQQRGIKVKDIIECVSKGEIIEYYPYPSCLILGYSNNGKVNIGAGC